MAQSMAFGLNVLLLCVVEAAAPSRHARGLAESDKRPVALDPRLACTSGDDGPSRILPRGESWSFSDGLAAALTPPGRCPARRRSPAARSLLCLRQLATPLATPCPAPRAPRW